MTGQFKSVYKYYVAGWYETVKTLDNNVPINRFMQQRCKDFNSAKELALNRAIAASAVDTCEVCIFVMDSELDKLGMLLVFWDYHLDETKPEWRIRR